ncbi:hypothetical protein KIN20_018220 [Parelaphostrongylus tenuis]|uniref:Uncharacterized protein n=1 Tax=Parelaphostrongylus tenuis TaxID=148309 RepID=A0AAD5QS10_PARTN|nr:hypothetical protein KIN20_018220 [Parelaphostrongylus tenuis]
MFQVVFVFVFIFPIINLIFNYINRSIHQRHQSTSTFNSLATEDQLRCYNLVHRPTSSDTDRHNHITSNGVPTPLLHTESNSTACDSSPLSSSSLGTSSPHHGELLLCLSYIAVYYL